MAEQVAMLSDDERNEIMEDLDPSTILHDWGFWGRPEQFAPSGNWSVWLILSGRGFGKALSNDTPIPTPSGFTQMGDLQVGDQVLDQAGQSTQVVGVYPQGARKMLKITFDDQSSIVADTDHLWTVFTAQGKKQSKYASQHDVRDRDTNWWESKHSQTITSSNLCIGDSVPIQPGLSLPDADLPIDPYTLGAWLGDGDSRYPSIYGIDDEIFEHIANAYVIEENKRDPRSPKLRSVRFGFEAPSRNRDGYGMSSNGMSRTLRNLNLIKNKHIPAIYFRGSHEQRLELLRGLMDTDGTISKNGLNAGVGFVSKQLRDDVSHLLSTLGIKHNRLETLKGVAKRPETRKPFYSVSFRPTLEVNPFALKRKANRVIPMPRAQATKKYWRRIIQIENAGTQEATCISVNSTSKLFLAGKDYVSTHNTRAGSEWVRDKATKFPGCRIHLLGRTSADVRDVMVGGDSGIMAVCPDGEKPEYFPSKRMLKWPNGSTALMFSATEPDQLRGPQADFTWADEVAAFPHIPDASGLTAWDNARIANRLGEMPQLIATTTPKRVPVIKDLLALSGGVDSSVVVTRGSTKDNKGNLSGAYLDVIYGVYAGSHLASQELEGILTDEVDGALWSDDMLNAARALTALPPLPLRIIAVDPSVSATPKDECGIVVVGATAEKKLHHRHAYVLEDATVHGSPEVWARAVVETARKWKCPVVAEGNQGGDLVRMAIHSIDPSIIVFQVTARQNKQLRAEPVVAVYEQKRVHHVGYLPTLEAQQTSWVPAESKKSPDRVDAVVYGIQALLIKPPEGLVPAAPLRAKSPARAKMGNVKTTGRRLTRRLGRPTAA